MAARRPHVRVIKPGHIVRPRRGLREWIRAWKLVLRDPDKPIPDAAVGPEGEPIPAELDIHCPECGYSLSGLTQWRCPECGERFNPMRAYTLRMLQEPEYFLRYRLDPMDIRMTLGAVLLVAAGLAAALVATVVAVRRGQGGPLPIATAWYAISGIIGLSIPLAALLHLGLDVALPRIAFFFATAWFVMCLVLLALACL